METKFLCLCLVGFRRMRRWMMLMLMLPKQSWRFVKTRVNLVQADASMFLSDSRVTVESWCLQPECHSQYVANLTAKQLCMQGTTARCGSSTSGRGSSVLLNMLSLELWLWNEDFMQRPQVVSSTDICFVRPFASLQSQCILDFIFFV